MTLVALLHSKNDALAMQQEKLRVSYQHAVAVLLSTLSIRRDCHNYRHRIMAVDAAGAHNPRAALHSLDLVQTPDGSCFSSEYCHS